jgi:hypothetical protein
VGIDRPEDADVPPDRHSDRPADRAPAETRYRQEYDTELRATVALRDRTEPAVPSRAREPTENGQPAPPSSTWEERAELSGWMWTEYKRRWPPEERPPVDRSKDAPGSWRGDNDRFLKPADNERVEAACDRIADCEREKITPALRAIESQGPDRHLVGLKDCRKGRDRIKEKVCGTINDFIRSPEQAVSLVPDAIRYTFQYEEAHYDRGVGSDIVRMQEQGFKLKVLRNYWSNDQYKGINSQWVEPDTGQRFELQFHTRISFEAKQLTHGAYERLRTLEADKFEELVLEAFQKKVTADVPVPAGAANIPDYPKRGTDAG